MEYPVSEKVCSGCQMCALVTHTTNGTPMDETQWYYQCLAMAQSECKAAIAEYDK